MSKAPRERVVRTTVRLWSKADARVFWEVEQVDAVLTKRSGNVGGSMRTTQKRCRDWFFASHELERAVAAQLAKGFTRRAPAAKANANDATHPVDAILDELDRAQAAGDFPDLESFMWIVVAARLHLFANAAKRQWGIAIEEITYSPSAVQPHALDLRLHRFGNAFRGRGARWLRPFEAKGVFDWTTIDADDDVLVLVPERAGSFRAWSRVVPVPVSAADYRRARVKLENAPLIRKNECLALLAKAHRDALFAPRDEVLRWRKAGVAHLATLDHWKHTDGPPSESATFRKLAKRLARA